MATDRRGIWEASGEAGLAMGSPRVSWTDLFLKPSCSQRKNECDQPFYVHETRAWRKNVLKPLIFHNNECDRPFYARREQVLEFAVKKNVDAANMNLHNARITAWGLIEYPLEPISVNTVWGKRPKSNVQQNRWRLKKLTYCFDQI